MNSINTGMITAGKSLCLGEAKMVATSINVLNSFNTIFPSYWLFFRKTVPKTRLYYYVYKLELNSEKEGFMASGVASPTI